MKHRLSKIKREIREVPFDSLNKIKKWRKFRYPKLVLLIIIIIFSYFLFKNPIIQNHVIKLGGLSYIGIFIAGMLFAFGFSAPLAVGFLIIAKPENIILAALIAGSGALISDLLIFKFIKLSFKKEFNYLKNEKSVKQIRFFIKKNLGVKISTYLMYFLAGFLIASPLPDEVGVIMLAGLTEIKQKILAIISFTLNTLGILLILIATS